MAMEMYRHAAMTLVLPPQWQEQPVTDNAPLPAAGTSQASGTPPASPETVMQLKSMNVARAQAWVRERFVPGSPPLSLADILTIHRTVAKESNVEGLTPGALRTYSVQVGRPEVGGLHAGAPHERLPLYMEQYVDFINSREQAGLPPAIHALLAHFFFTTLHPFGDGNGRTSRLVGAAILCWRGYNMHGGFYALSDYFYQNDSIAYHTLLHRCWQQGVPFNLTPFVAFGIEGMVMELRSIDSLIRMKLKRAVERDAAGSGRNRRRRKIESTSSAGC